MPKIPQSNPNDDRYIDDVEWWERHFDSLEDAYEEEERSKARRDSELDYQMATQRKSRRRYGVR
jgi:anti-sigma-K factor RskA